MEKEWIVRFLVKETIKEKEDERGRLWDAIYKAHRDTMTGARTNNINSYCAANRGGANKTLDLLYETIKEQAKTGPLCSQPLIDVIQKGVPKIEFGAVQKLVNMTLKYIIILNEVEPGFNIDVCEEKCDCPIDSIILGKLKNRITLGERIKKEEIVWTTITPEDYKEVQKEIEEILGKEHPNIKGKIWYDFLNWKAK